MPRGGIGIEERGRGPRCEKMKRKRNNVGERKSRTLVMPRDGMRIVEPGQGPWCERMKKKGRMEEKGSPGLLLCHAVARGTWHPIVDRGAKKKKKKEKGHMRGA